MLNDSIVSCISSQVVLPDYEQDAEVEKNGTGFLDNAYSECGMAKSEVM